MTESLKICVVLAMAIVRVAPVQAEEPARRPNILFIFADDQSWKTIGCYNSGPDWVRTPHIDALASAGVRFERSYLGAWCMPSRASLLTGRLQHAVRSMTMLGNYPGSKYDPEQCRFFPAQLRQSGYHTAQIGKWHTGSDTGFGRDWDQQVVWNRPGRPENAGNYYHDQVLEFNGVARQVDGYSTDNYTDWAVQYIGDRGKQADQPWFLWLCYGAIYGPTTPAARHQGTLSGRTTAPPTDIVGPWPDKPAWLQDTAAWTRDDGGGLVMASKKGGDVVFDANRPGKSFDAWIQQVHECNAAVDEGVGRVLQALRDSGQLENTLVIYSADQGFALGEHGLTQKVAPYDAAVSSPLIISLPGRIVRNRVCRHPVNAPDLTNYLCQLAGVQLPWETHGRDIRPLLESPEASDWNLPMIMTHTSRSYGDETAQIPTDDRLTSSSSVPWYVLLRDGSKKYVRYFVKGELEELYDLAADPDELVNLAVRPEHSAELARLRRLAIAELRRTDAQFVDGLPATAAELGAVSAP
ncbi:MAG: sulfatase-like hydrolase/transferase [Planctomyces sp.]